MRSVVTPVEMAAIDAAAPEPVGELIERAAWAVAREAGRMLDDSLYGRRIAIIAGPGNNGADGRGAVRHLQQRGARCTVFNIDTQAAAAAGQFASGRHTHAFDLVIDAAFGTGLRRDFDPGDIGSGELAAVMAAIDGGAPVLAVDIPSGIDGATGQVRGRAIPANRTITFAALKPGLLLQPGRSFAGETVVADIGLDCSRATITHLDVADVRQLWPTKAVAAHKWGHAVAVIGGSPGMTGAPSLTSAAALRSGAGYVTQLVPGSDHANLGVVEPMEAVQRPVSAMWAADALDGLDRFSAVVIGPGLAPTEGDQLVSYLGTATTPTVLDAGALTSLAALGKAKADAAVSTSAAPLVMTPHDGEFARLFGASPRQDRLADTRAMAARFGAVVLRKGPTTIVANPDGRVLLSTAGDARLATAGTGDVLSGIIAAGIAGGLDPLLAAGLGAVVHGHAAMAGFSVGLTARDIPPLVAEFLSDR